MGYSAVMDDINMNHNPCVMSVGNTFKEVLVAAKQQNRLTTGLYESGKMLEMNPDGVMFCILPASVDDVTLHIHFTLIEAFCYENDIKVLKVDSTEKLAEMVRVAGNDNDIAAGRLDLSAGDYHCVLVEYPTGTMSDAEEQICEHHKKMLDIETELAVIELGV